jgi:hypothetical protein
MYYVVLLDFPIDYEKKRILAEFASIVTELRSTVEDLLDKLTSYAMWVKSESTDEAIRRSEMKIFRDATVDRLLKVMKLVGQLNAMYSDFVESVKAVISTE